MGASLTTLDYAKGLPKSRWRFVLLISLFLIVAAGSLDGWRHRAAIYDYIQNKIEDWKYAWAFEHAERELFSGSDTYLPSSDGQRPDARATEQLTALLALAPLGGPNLATPLNPGIVLFSKEGQTSGQRWLAFAYASQFGLEVITFKKANRRITTMDRVLDSREFWPAELSCDLKVGAIQKRGAEVVTDLIFNGGHNSVVWSIQPQVISPGSETKMPDGSVLNPSDNPWITSATATPQDALIDGDVWWPTPAGWHLRQATPPSQYFSAIGGGNALAYLPDDRISVISQNQLQLVSHNRPARIWPLNIRLENPSYYFSPDGTKLYLYDLGYFKAWLIDARDGMVRECSRQPCGPPAIAFCDNSSFIFIDNVSKSLVNWDSQQTQKLNLPDLGIPGPATYGLSATGPLMVLPGSANQANVVNFLTGRLVGSFEEVDNQDQLSLSPDGHWLAMEGRSGSFRLFDVATGTKLFDIDLYGDLRDCHPIKWSSDSSRCAVAGRINAYVWSMRQPRWFARLPWPNIKLDLMTDVAFSSDSRSLIACAEKTDKIAYWSDIGAALKPDR